MIATLAYIALVLAVIAAVLLFGIWMLSVWAGRGSGTTTQVTRYTTDWIGRPKQEHFDGDGNKVGESRPDTDWLGNPKMVNTDAEGNVIGESKPDTDWLGNPKTVHRDTQGNVVTAKRSPGHRLARNSNDRANRRRRASHCGEPHRSRLPWTPRDSPAREIAKVLTFFYVNRNARVYVRQLAVALEADSPPTSPASSPAWPTKASSAPKSKAASSTTPSIATTPTSSPSSLSSRAPSVSRSR